MKKNFKIIIGILAAVILVAAGIYFFCSRLLSLFYFPTLTAIQPGVTSKNIPALPNIGPADNQAQNVSNIRIIAQNLFVPWEIVFLPNGDILATERNGQIKKINGGGITFRIDGVSAVGEGGLLGMAVHPGYILNGWVYIYLTTNVGEEIINQVERYVFDSSKGFSEKKVILSGIPASSNHNGGRIAFDANGYLYITTGDAGNSNLAQDTNSLAGKILRIRDDGTIPSDNPFGNAVWSYGHRNSQGITWDDKGRMWATEHGRSGTLSGLDELNLIVKGSNYGWPTIQGDKTKAGMTTSIINSGPNETWAPAGIVYYDGSLFFTGLRGESLYEAKIDKSGKVSSLLSHFYQEYGRLRALKISPDGFFYFSTSNRDGRGMNQSEDDKIIKINPKIFR